MNFKKIKKTQKICLVYQRNASAVCNGPSSHSAPVNKHNEMRSRFGLTISLCFVHPGLQKYGKGLLN